MSKKVIHLWTDGSSVNNGEEKGLGGCGYVLLVGKFDDSVDLKTKYCDDKFTKTGFASSSVDTTNQREEIRAVIEGLKQIKNNDIPIHVFSDSAYLINCMNKKWYVNWRDNGWKNSKKQDVVNPELWQELLQIIEDGFLNVTFNKVKGHSGIYYNELADVEANKGLSEARANVIKDKKTPPLLQIDEKISDFVSSNSELLDVTDITSFIIEYKEQLAKILSA